MAIAPKVLEALESLPEDKQAEAIDFIEFLAQRESGKRVEPVEDSGLVGLWADLNIDFKDEYLDEIRREMWQGFPREDLV